MTAQRYLVTARKYRPQKFREIVAQEHVSETLKNALKLDRLAHAYLFSGPRGVGKTTAARILAKAINCETPIEKREDGEPCRSCDSCKTFEEGRSFNIHEIDAASNNRVEDIRDLREAVLIPPQGNRKKVYIVDEVHMLSNAAFNALLKTLEEPPPHALFIFATTEPRKVLPTILSRCQRFDFRRISVAEIVAHLEEICSTESISADEASLMLIAQKGDGALRDALSAFDQAVSLCGSNLTYPELAKGFGVVEVDLFFEVTECAAAGKNDGLLTLVDRIIRQGYDLQEFLAGLAEHLRNLIVARTMPDTSLIEAAEPIKKRYDESGKTFEETDLLRMLMVTDEGIDRLKSSTQPRLQLELTLLKIASMPRAVDVQKALNTLARLEANASKISDPIDLPRQEQPAAPPNSPPANPGQPEGSHNSPPPEYSAPPSEAHTAPDTPLTPIITEDPSGELDFEPVSPPAEKKPPPVSPKLQPDAPSQSSYEGLFGMPALRKVDRPNSQEGGDTSAVAHEDVLVAEAPGQELEEVRRHWNPFLEHIKQDRIHISALLQNAKPVDLRDRTLVLSVPDDFHKRMLASQEAYLQENLTSFVTNAVDRMSYLIDLGNVGDEPGEESTREIDPKEFMKRRREDNPVVRAIFDDFGGEIVW